jgi:hypothetical protein
MGYYQKLWGDVSLHEALNGQVGRDFAGQMRARGRNEHRDWAAGYVNAYTDAPSHSPLADKSACSEMAHGPSQYSACTPRASQSTG